MNIERKFTEKLQVDHTYIDYSHIPPEKDDNKIQSNSDSKSNHDDNTSFNFNFPKKLHELLSKKEYSHIITWMPHGRSWKILNKDEFISIILKEYFSDIKYSSFTRKVNRWGFKRITQGEDISTYYHELFLRGMPHLIKRMRRPSMTSTRNVVPAEDQPDFYLMSIDYPLPETEYEEKKDDDKNDNDSVTTWENLSSYLPCPKQDENEEVDLMDGCSSLEDFNFDSDPFLCEDALYQLTTTSSRLNMHPSTFSSNLLMNSLALRAPVNDTKKTIHAPVNNTKKTLKQHDKRQLDGDFSSQNKRLNTVGLLPLSSSSKAA